MNSNMGRRSSFRENDDAFLQKQTRIWLGEVLSTRLDEQVDISDLLADGELLSEVSKVLWNSLLTKSADHWHLKEKLKGPTASRKSGGRYMPYSNVDSFLKICKIFGLDGVDLFSPSDVVEKNNTRKVCICIRALSRKARLKRLHLPNFDVVTCTVAKPTDMVGSLQKSLESPQSSFSISSTYNSHEQASSTFEEVKKLLIPGDVAKNDVSSEGSDEAESNFRVSIENGDTLRSQINSAQDIDLSVQNDFFAPEILHYSTEEKDYISEYLAFSDSVILGTDCGSPMFGREENTCNFFTGINAQGSNLKPRNFETGSQMRDSDVEDELSSTTSMGSILGRVLAMFDERFDLVDISHMNDHPERFRDNKAKEYLAKGTMGSCGSDGLDECGAIASFSCDEKGHILETKGENIGHDAAPSAIKPEYIQMQSDSDSGQEKDFLSNDIELVDEGNEKSILSEDTGSTDGNTIESEFSDNQLHQHTIAQDLADKKTGLSATGLKNLRCSSHNISVEDRENCYHLYQENRVTRQIESFGEPINSDLDIYPTGCVSPQEFYQSSSSKLVEIACITTNQECQQPVVGNLSEFRGDMNNEHSRIQPQRNLFNRVAIGTGIVGVLLFLLHLSKRVGDVSGKLVKKSGQMQNYCHSKSSK